MFENQVSLEKTKSAVKNESDAVVKIRVPQCGGGSKNFCQKIGLTVGEAKEKKPWGERKIKYEPENKYISNSFMRYPLRGATHLQERPIYEKIEIGSRQNYAPTQH